MTRLADRVLETIRGCLSLALITLNTILHALPIYAGAALRLLLRDEAKKNRIRRLSANFAESWIGFNNRVLNRYPVDWQIRLPDNLEPDQNYFVNSNHQSWVDIVVLQRVFNRRIPFMRFFLKQQLIWVPFLGPAWWALDFPFMRRYSKQQLAANPELKRKDLETTERMCKRLAGVPISIMNFLEGTRFTAGKHRAQQSPFTHLLKPKAGGLAYTLTTLKDQIRQMLDVSIVYPNHRPSLWDLMCGRVDRIIVDVREVQIPDWLPGGDYQGDVAYRQRLQDWLNDHWQRKDRLVGELTQQAK